MTGILIIFMLVILALIVLVVVCARATNDYRERENDQYYDKEGNHSYYERSIIEKRNFTRKHPEIKGLRTFRRLFSRHG